MKFDAPQRQARQVTEEDIAKIFAQEAVYCNKFYLTVQTDGAVRLVFADIDAEDNHMNTRFSAIIPAAAFHSFAALIQSNEQHARAVMQMLYKQHSAEPTNTTSPATDEVAEDKKD